MPHPSRATKTAMPPLTIGIVIHDFNLGGSERIAIRLANYWREQGHNIIIFCGQKNGQMLDLLSKDITVIPASPLIIRGKNSVRALAHAARKYFSSHQVDFCYIPGNYHWLVSRQLQKIAPTSRPIIVSQISSLIYKPKRKPICQKIFNIRMKYLLKKSDIVVAMDELTAKQSNSILKRDDTLTIPLPALPMRPSVPTITHAHTPYSVLAAGRLTEQKGFDTLINAFRLVVDTYPEAKLTICGEGEDRPALEAQIKSLHLEKNIHLQGYVADITPDLRENSLFVLSSRREGYGAVLLEALDAGCRVVTTDCTPAIRDIFMNTPAGSVVPVDNVSALSTAIIKELATFSSERTSHSDQMDRYRINVGGDLYLDAVRSIQKSMQ